MKKVLICAPFTKGDLFVHRFVTPPLGVWRIGSYLNNNGHYCRVYDKADPSNVMSFEDLVNSDDWGIIAFSTQTATEEYDIEMMFKARELKPNALLVAGGSGAALNYQFILDKTPIDIVVLAEGEYPMLDLCNDKDYKDIEGIVFRKRAKVMNQDDYWNINKGLDVKGMHADKYWEKTSSFYEVPNFDEINTFRLFTMNYCPLGCKFCTLTNWKKYAAGCHVPVVFLKPEQVLFLVKQVVKNYINIRRIFFVDDDFFLHKQRGEDFCRLVIEAKKNGELPEYLSFISVMNIARINDQTLDLMVKAGFKVLSIGVESTSQYVLNSLNKKQTVEQIWTATQKILDYGLKPYYTLLAWTPFCRIEDVITDLRGFRRLSSMGVGLSIEPYLIPLPGTPLWEERIPERTRWVDIENTGVRIRKGFAWLPVDKEVRKVFDRFEILYAKYRKYMFEKEKHIKHKEKNWQAMVLLDILEITLREFGYIQKENVEDMDEILETLNLMSSYDVDVVGDIKEKDSFNM